MSDIKNYEVCYSRKSFEEKQIYYRRKKLLEIMNKYKHDYVLEIGCGNDPLFMHLDSYKSMSVVEVSDLFYEYACNLAKNNSRVFCYKGFFEDKVNEVLKDCPKLDFIFGSMLLELEDIQKGYDALYDLCSEDTVLYLCLSNAMSLHRIVAYEAGIIDRLSTRSELSKDMLQYNEPYTLEQLCLELENNGFEVIEKGSYFPKLFTHGQLYKMLEKNIISDKLLEGMYKMEKYLPEYGSEIFVVCKKK